MRPPVRLFLGTYALALLVLVIVGIAAVYVASLLGVVIPGYGTPRPAPARLAAYAIEYSIADPQSRTTLRVGEDGAACQSLAKSELFRTACVLALNEDPAFIAGEAFGRLNTEDTPAYEAIIWRARIDADPTVCTRGGLLDVRLATCRAAASGGPYVRTDRGITVVIGAEGSGPS